jgi:predicted amidohydrolase
MDLKVTAIQSELHWENVDENLKMFSEKIVAIPEQTDIVVLPEMFNTGFSMKSEELSETMSGKAVSWMLEMSKKANAVIVGSLIIKEDNEFYNRLVWVQPNGEINTYDKRHLFRMADEHSHFNAGSERIIIEYKGWKICPLVCYDLRFPVWSRNTSDNQYDVLVYIANWPAARKAPWSKLLEARAIENQCYVVGVNRVGEDGKGFTYSGNSAIINPKGEPISSIPENENYTQTVNLSLEDLNTFRKVFPVGMDADEFKITHSQSS